MVLSSRRTLLQHHVLCQESMASVPGDTRSVDTELGHVAETTRIV